MNMISIPFPSKFFFIRQPSIGFLSEFDEAIVQEATVCNTVHLSLVFANDSFKKRFEYSNEELSDLKLSDLLSEGSLPENEGLTKTNNAAIMHYGYTENEFLSMTHMDIRGKQDPPTKEFLRKKEDRIGSRNNKNYKSSFTHVKKCGEKINVEIYTSPIDINERQGILCVAIDVTERTEFENKITRAIIKTQEDERYEIGSELHDNVCQILAAAKMSLGMIKPSLVPQAIQSYNKSYEAINLATIEIKNLSHRLAPAFFDNAKLEEAFKSLLKSFNITDAYEVSVYFDKSSKEHVLSQDIKLNLYRILQEQLRNIVEHAHCSIIEVSVFIFDQHLHMRIADNGVGFDENHLQHGIGMANMKRRAELFAGKLFVQSKRGKGCEVLVKIPVEKLN